MRYLKSMLTGLLVVAVGSSLAFGQQQDQRRMHQPDTSQGMMMQDQMRGMMGMMRAMEGGMMQQMMESPMHRSMMVVHVLPAMADTLGLSDEQTARLEQLRQELQTARQQAMRAMTEARQQMQELMQGDTPDPDRVRTLMEQMAEQRADMMATGYETGVEMQQVLTEEQRQMLAGMSPQQMRRHMMAHMSMMDMMQMMRMMHGGMMDGKMMDGRMMGGSGDRQNMPSRHRHNR